MMAFEFLGGRARCGRPWHPYGVHARARRLPRPRARRTRRRPRGQSSTKREPRAAGTTPTDGRRSRDGRRTTRSLTSRSITSGSSAPGAVGCGCSRTCSSTTTSSASSIPTSATAATRWTGFAFRRSGSVELERYIDAQNGGPGEGWFRIVDDPFEAREVINDGKLAVVLGIEVSVPLDCGLDPGHTAVRPERHRAGARRGLRPRRASDGARQQVRQRALRRCGRLRDHRRRR